MTYVRQEFGDRVKRARWEHCDGKCEGEGCGADLTIPGTRIEYDHHVACKDDGDNSFENCRVLCKWCHAAKTFGPDAEKFKTIRKREKRDAGIRKRSKFPCSRDSGLKKKLDGTIVSRQPRIP